MNLPETPTTRLVYLGPLRLESLTALVALAERPQQALFITPEEPEAHWGEVTQWLPDARQQTAKLAPHSGEHPWYRYNLPEFNASQAATGLHVLYPGLELLESTLLRMQPLQKLVEDFIKQPAQRLVIEQPELCQPLLDALEQQGVLNGVQKLWLRTGQESLYENMPDEITLQTWCEQHGFEVEQHGGEDPDFPLLMFKRNPLHAELAVEQARITELTQALTEAGTALKTAHKEIESARQQQQHLIQQADKTTAQLKAEQSNSAQLTKEMQSLTTERDQARKELKKLQQDHVETQAKLKNTQQWFMSRKEQAEEGAEKLKRLEAERDALKAENDERTQQHGKLAKELEQARVIARSEATKQSQALDEANKQIEVLTQQLASKENSLHKTEESFSSLESKLDQLFGEQRSYIQQTTNALGQHVTRSAKQQRDEQALTHYLQQGQRPVSTTLAPGYAMAMLEQRDTQRYDVVVVFGSPAATELLAQAVMNEQGSQQRLTHASQPQGNDTAVVAPSQDDLPQSILSFEHQKAQCKALKKRLGERQCRQAVNVVHAPWVESHFQGQTPLFYACEATLQRLNQWLREDAKVLVVLGPALPHAGHSRLAALPQLLQHLPTQRLDIVIESTDAPHEQGLASEWETLLNARQREVQWLTMPAALSLRVEG